MVNWTNIITGFLQVLIPAGFIFAERKGIIPANATADLMAIFGTLIAGTHSAFTTQVTSK